MAEFGGRGVRSDSAWQEGRVGPRGFLVFPSSPPLPQAIGNKLNCLPQVTISACDAERSPCPHPDPGGIFTPFPPGCCFWGSEKGANPPQQGLGQVCKGENLHLNHLSDLSLYTSLISKADQCRGAPKEKLQRPPAGLLLLGYDQCIKIQQMNASCGFLSFSLPGKQDRVH